MKVGARYKGLGSPQDVQEALSQALYIASEDLATAIYLAMALGKPLLLEGAPGVGKTEAAKALSSTLSCELIRLQCYEGIDANTALYEWNFPRQILAMRQANDAKLNIYDPEFLIARPLLQALHLQSEGLLLIDEIDRADHEFEAFLLEFLSDFQITIPERGRIRASQRPFVILTSNRTRDLHEALRRRRPRLRPRQARPALWNGVPRHGARHTRCGVRCLRQCRSRPRHCCTRRCELHSEATRRHHGLGKAPTNWCPWPGLLQGQR